MCRWRAFGDTPPNEDVDGDGQSTTVNLRFPGQYFDEETQFHYNGFRYYHSGTGRYGSSDRIGLNGGLNTYSYADTNPVTLSDPLGLYTWSGTISGGEFAAFGAVGIYYMELESQCVNGKKARVKVLGFGGGIGAGVRGPKRFPLPSGKFPGTPIQFDDFRISGEIDPHVFEGDFQTAGGGVQPIWGFSTTKIKCGQARASDTGFGFGLNLGASAVIVGDCSVLGSPQFESCCGG